jgi:uncharacterized protein (DUF488 family)
MLRRLLTIGAFGFDEESFFKAIVASGADLFCDIRARRGVRGSEYAFVNSARLQAGLQARGVRYVHFKDLAPTQDMRDTQYAADKGAGVAKRKRPELSPQFAAAYREGRLNGFDSRAFATEALAGATSPIFFCVEREPGACHRSLVAAKLAQDLGLPVEDLRP